MKIFGLDTTRKIAKIIVYDIDNDKKYVLAMGDGVKHSEGLFLYIEKALMENGLKIGDFDCYSAVTGPGSFTGIRVGMSTIKGFAKVGCKKIIPINIFEIVAKKIGRGVMILNSTSTSCYYAKISGKKIAEAGVIDKDKVFEEFTGMKIFALSEEKTTLNIENADIEYFDNLDDLYFDAILEKIDTDDDFVPYYLQLSQAERNLKNE